MDKQIANNGRRMLICIIGVCFILAWQMITQTNNEDCNRLEDISVAIQPIDSDIDATWS